MFLTASSGRIQAHNTVTFGGVETTSIDSYRMAMEERYVYDIVVLKLKFE